MKPIIVRGGGDLATGTIWQLCRAGYPVIILECSHPMAIRREAAFCEAVRFGSKTVEGLTCQRVDSIREALERVSPSQPVLLVDEACSCLKDYQPDVLVDAILAKKNLGTRIDMADLVIGIGPGFTAGVDVDFVVETVRGHKLARIIEEGSALPNTGTPGIIAGYGRERVIHAPADGILTDHARIGDIVEKDQPIAHIRQTDGEEVPVPATLTGVLRGILPDGYPVWKGLKMADIDPRKEEVNNCFTISDKARCIAGTVVTLVTGWYNGVR